jgi:hypothetical protein
MKVPGTFLTFRGVSIPALLLFIMATSYNYADSDRSPQGNGRVKEKEHHASAEDSGKSDFGKKTLSDAEEQRSYRKDNVVITVKKLYADDRLSWNFEVTVENQNDIKKTVEGSICLFNMYIQPRECGSEECGVNIVVQPKSVQIQKYKCRGKMDMNSWAFLIARIHNY